MDIRCPAVERTTRAYVVVLWSLLAACSLMLMVLNNSVDSAWTNPLTALTWSRDPVSERTRIIYCRGGIANVLAALCQIYNKSYLPLRNGVSHPHYSIAERWTDAHLLGKSPVLVLHPVLRPTRSAPISFERRIFTFHRVQTLPDWT
jgi:hypothetical protein